MNEENYNFFAMLNRLSLIERWSLMQCRQKENVCEHSYQVAIIVQALYYIRLNKLTAVTLPQIKLDLGELLQLALLHDATEVITGDLPTPVKYYNPELKQAYKVVEDIAAQRLLALLPSELQANYRPLILTGENTAAAGTLSEQQKLNRLFIKAADKISALIKCRQEAALGNQEFASACSKTEQRIGELQLPEADYFVQHFVRAFSMSLDDLNHAALDAESKESVILQNEYRIE